MNAEDLVSSLVPDPTHSLLRDPWLSDLFDADVATAACRTVGAEAEALLHPEEAAIAAGFGAERRRREFAAGRACAHRLLASLGVPAGPIGIGGNRAPVWPPGVVGSISHSGGLCVVALARRGSVRSLGVDVESDAPLPLPLLRRICTEPELDELAQASEPERAKRGKLYFSAKEAVYKCLRPQLPGHLGWQTVALRFDFERRGFSARAAQPGSQSEALAEALRGHFAWRGGYVLSAATLRQPRVVAGQCQNTNEACDSLD